MKCGSVVTILIRAALAAVICTAGCIGAPAPEDNATLLIYSGAGLKGQMSEIGTLFGEKNGVTVDLTYGGSGVLISQMETSHLEDVFIPGGQPGQPDYQNAMKKGVVTNNSQLVAYHVPIIAVQKGNPLGIKTVADLAEPDVQLALGDVNATEIGKAGVVIFKNYDVADQIEQNIVLRGATINEVVTAMSTGNADAALLTMDNAKGDKFDLIEIPVTDNSILIASIGVTTFTKQPELAQKFADFVACPEGQAIFENYGFPAYPNAKYTT